MAELRERFAGEVAALGDCLGRDLLAQWGIRSRPLTCGRLRARS